jgi:exonuclease III
MAFSIASINANGLRGIGKRAALFDWFQNSSFDILFIQECHCVSETEVRNWTKDFRGKGFWSFGTLYSCGVGILIKQRVSYKISNVFRDTEGRLLLLDLKIHDQSFRLVNIYCPCDDPQARKKFITALDVHLITSRFIILAGDFNFTVDNRFDKVGGNPNSGTEGAAEMRRLCYDFSLLDVYRQMYPHTVSVTWSSANGTISCRLDRIYISNTLDPYVSNSDVTPVAFSDHKAVTLDLDLPNVAKIGPGFWKCNTSVLNDPKFVQDLENRWSDWSDVAEFTSTWWDLVKVRFKQLVIKHSKRLAQEQRARIKILEDDLVYLVKMDSYNPGTYKFLIDNTKAKLMELFSERQVGVKLRSKVQILEESEKPTRFFLKREHHQATSSVISYLNINGNDIMGQDEIAQAVSNFYSELFTSQPIDESLLDYFVHDLPTLKEEDKSICEGPITLTECEHAIKAMSAHKSPGLDGLPMEFYLRFFYLIGPSYVRMMNRCFEEMAMPLSQKHGVIKLLCKDDTHPELLKNWRPISLLNVDYKILTKILTTRLSRVIGSLVHLDQTSSVPGRSILDNLHLVRNIIDYLDFKKLPGILVSLDQEKAFDRVSHQFLFSVLKNYGFGPQFQRWIRLIYTDISSSVLVNGYLSPKFFLTRGVRQGCSLSPLLYILCLEPLLIKIRQDNQITGIPVPGEQEQAKVIAFADDVAIITSNESSVRKLLGLTECFENASGSKLNRLKTFGIWLGTWADRVDSVCNIHFSRDIQKFYGILLERGHFSIQNWEKLLNKFKTTLGFYLDRDLTIRGRSVIAQSMACSKLWYVGAVSDIPSVYLSSLNASLFNFVWAHKPEWVNRKVMSLPPSAGGMGVVNIEQKLNALRLMHLRDFILGTSAKWFYFTRYFVGFHLRKFNAVLYSRLRPHQVEFVPPFYVNCLKVLDIYLKACPDPVWKGLKCSSVYVTLLSLVDAELVIKRFFPALNFDESFRQVHNKFIDPPYRELNWKIVHKILPVKFMLCARHIINENKCPLCKTQPEMLDHLFLMCPSVQPLLRFVRNILFTVYNARILFNRQQFLFLLSLPKTHTDLFLYLISLVKYVIWFYRNKIVFEKFIFTPQMLVSHFKALLVSRVRTDFHRFSEAEFWRKWPKVLVDRQDDSVIVNF